MKKISKKKLSIISAIIVAILIVGGVSAYLTDTDNKTNVFTVGSVKISLNEPNWNQSNGQYVIPGQTVQKDPTIENIGHNSAYVYMKVVEPLVTQSSGSTGPLFSYTTNSGWTQLSTCSTSSLKVTVYYYNTALASGNSTNALFNTVTIGDYDQDLNSSIKNIDITGYAIQSSYLPSGTTIQNAFDTYFEDQGISECTLNTIYRWSTSIFPLGKDISTLTEGTDYVRDKSDLPSMNSNASTYYLKHDIKNNRITNSYVCINVTSEMKISNPAMTVGDYCIEGGDSGTAYNSNKTTLTEAFGSTNCNEENQSGTIYYKCSVSGLRAQTLNTGMVRANNGGSYCCDVGSDGRSDCFSCSWAG